MRNQTPKQTEPSHDGIALGACEILDPRPGSFRLAATVKPKPQPAAPGGRETQSKFIKGLRRAQIQKNTAMNVTDSLAEWCRQLPALQLKNGGALGF